MKKILKLGLSALALSVLAACGNSGSSAASSATGLSTGAQSSATGLSTESSEATGLSTEDTKATVFSSEDSLSTGLSSEELSDESEDSSDDTEESSDDTEDSSDDTEESSDESGLSSEEESTTDLYLAGTFNDWGTYDTAYALDWDALTEVYYIYDVSLKANAEFKVMGHVSGEEKWYPENGNVKVVEAGQYDIEFDPATGSVDANWVDEYKGEIGETTYYLVGSFNEWTKNENYAFGFDEENECYALKEIALEGGAKLKVNDSDGNWYPGGVGNDYVVEKAATYDILFDPNGGHEGWYAGYFILNELK